MERESEMTDYSYMSGFETSEYVLSTIEGKENKKARNYIPAFIVGSCLLLVVIALIVSMGLASGQGADEEEEETAPLRGHGSSGGISSDYEEDVYLLSTTELTTTPSAWTQPVDQGSETTTSTTITTPRTTTSTRSTRPALTVVVPTVVTGSTRSTKKTRTPVTLETTTPRRTTTSTRKTKETTTPRRTTVRRTPTTLKTTTTRRVTLKTTPRTVKTTTKKTTTRKTTVRTTTTTTTTTTKKPFKEQPVLCSVGRFATSKSMYPDDGLCDLIFYTHVRIVDNEVAAVDEPRSLHTFKKVSAGMSRTKAGISFDWRYTWVDQLTGNAGKSMLGTLWKTNIPHYGVLNGDGSSRHFVVLSGRLRRVFQRLFEIQSDFNPDTTRNPNYLVMASKLLMYNNKNEKDKYRLFLKELASFKINMLIVNTAVNTWNNDQPCLNYPPTMWGNLQSNYQPSFEEAIRILKAAALDNPPVILFAFTMGVTVYRMTDPHSTKNLFDRECDSYTMVPFTQLCESETANVFRKAVKVPLAEAFVAFYDEYSYAWDTSETLRVKMNRTMFEYPEKRLGIMLFDVEYEDSKPTCAPATTGTFPRVRAVRKFMDDFARKARQGRR